MVQFEVGKTYATRFITNSDSIASFTVKARTPKRITVEYNGQIIKRGIYTWADGIEQFKPFGTYSMCMVVGADDLVKV